MICISCLIHPVHLWEHLCNMKWRLVVTLEELKLKILGVLILDAV